MSLKRRRCLQHLTRALWAQAACALAACASAVVSLQHPTHPQAVPAVARLLSDDPLLAKEAKVEVVALGDGATPELLRRMPDATTEGKVRIIELATQIAAPPPVVALIYREGAADRDVRVRQTVAFQATRAPKLARQTAPALETLLDDRVPEVRASALRSLGALNVPGSLPPELLARMIEDPNPLICATAVSVSLPRDEPSLRAPLRRALPRLVPNLHARKAATRAAVISALGEYGLAASPTVPPLLAVAAKDPVPEVRVKAAIALMKINTPAARDGALATFREFASSSNASLRGVAEGYLKERNEDTEASDEGRSPPEAVSAAD